MGRFIAIFAISALGAGFYAGLRATGPDMKATGDAYYQSQRLMDWRVLSTLGFSGADVEALRATPGVDRVMPGYALDLLVEVPEGEEAARFSALPAAMEADDPAWLNRPVLTEGRMPTAAGECLLDSEAAYGIGDVITLAGENDEDSLEMMTQRAFTVVGKARSPLYVAFMRGNTGIGNGRLSFFASVLPEAFDSEVYTEVFLTAQDAGELSSFSGEYETLVEDGATRLEALGEERAALRYDEVYAEGETELADARAEVADAKKELADAKQELADAWQEILDGEKEIADGWAEVADNEKKLADAQKEIADGEASLYEAWSQLYQADLDYAAGLEQYNQGLAAYNQGLAEYQAGLAQVEGLASALAGLEQMAAAMQGALGVDDAAFVTTGQTAAATLRGLAAQMAAAGLDGSGLEAAAAAMEASLADPSGYPIALGALQGANAGLAQSIEAARAELAAAKAKLDAAAGELAAAKAELDAARRTIDTGWAEYVDGVAELTDAKAEVENGRKELADARVELADAEIELADGKAEYYEEKAKADREIADAEVEIADAEIEIADGQRKLDDLADPEWLVYTRDDNVGYSGFASDTGRIDALATTIPVFFFLVAALVCLTTMTRMVEEQRTQIGTLAALGYKKWQIAAKYVFYAAAASVSGALFGVAVGFFAFPTAIWEAYGMMYLMPEIRLGNAPWLAVSSTLVLLATTTLATLAACVNELRSVPATLMRPRPPRSGKRVFLERVGPLWRRLSFMQKVTVRNLVRYKKRFFMTVVGVAGCTALLLTGFGLRDSISGIVPRQYGGIETYDILAALSDPSDAGADSPLNALWPEYGDGLYVKQTVIDAESEDGSSVGMTVYFYVAEQPENLPGFIDMRERKSGEGIPFPPENGGVVVTEKLADRLGLKVGDSFSLARVNEKPREVLVGGITENYIMNYVYGTPAQYEALFGQAPEYDTLLLKLTDSMAGRADDVLNGVIALSGVAGAANISAYVDQFSDMFASLDAVVWLIILSAGLLAFVVLYNLTNINITERQREIATLKVLGFRSGEVAGYVYRENIILTFIGALLGLALGVLLHDYVVVTAEVDEVMFRRSVEFLSYIYSVVFTLASGMLVNFVMLRRLRRIDMVESLKSIE